MTEEVKDGGAAKEPYENTFTLEELRREVRRCWNYESALTEALQELPEVPSTAALRLLVSAAMNQRELPLWSIGKELQQRLGLDVVPPKTEYEYAAGMWSIIRTALLSARKDHGHE